MKISSRTGPRRVAGGFAFDAGRVHLIVCKRPDYQPESWSHTRDYSGYRTYRNGRLAVLHCWR